VSAAQESFSAPAMSRWQAAIENWICAVLVARGRGAYRLCAGTSYDSCCATDDDAFSGSGIGLAHRRPGAREFQVPIERPQDNGPAPRTPVQRGAVLVQVQCDIVPVRAVGAYGGRPRSQAYEPTAQARRPPVVGRLKPAFALRNDHGCPTCALCGHRAAAMVLAEGHVPSGWAVAPVVSRLSPTALPRV